MNQLTIIFTAFLVILVFTLPRKYFLLPFIIAACFVPADQRIIIMDLDFTPLRILVLVGFLRTILRRERLMFKWNRFDKLVLAWAICGAIVYILQWRDMRALIYKCGVLFDVIGLYWLFRISVSCWDDIVSAAKIFAVCSLVLAVLVGLEWSTGKNPFVVLGRVTTVVREERYRCQASFPHSIMLGLFWATLVPVFFGCIKKAKRQKWLYWLAIITSLFIIASTASSTPLLTLLAVLCFLPLFSYRRFGHQIAWALLGMTVALHIVMKAPVWHLISRINVIGGSTGWHRYHLIDEAIHHFGEWALLGSRSTGHWGFMLGDVTNHYIYEAVQGGLVTLIIFIALLVTAVKTIGGYSSRQIPSGQQWLNWGICASVLGHCIAFFGVAYFGQIMMLLYLTLAMVGTVYQMSTSSGTLVKLYTRKQKTKYPVGLWMCQ